VLERLFNISWYGKLQWTWLLWPLSLLVLYVTKKKRANFLRNKPEAFNVPVIVVGNITIGGTGKTPVVQSIVRYLISQGYRPGIVSRGYGGSIQSYPHLISDRDTANLVGDEPYMLFQSLKVPVVIDPVRKHAVQRLLSENVNVVISDDGLQHYGLHRDYEICVIDGSRGLGNQQIMPVGPLREAKERLKYVDYKLTSSRESTDGQFKIQPEVWVNVKTGKELALGQLQIQSNAMAIAGIGNPEKFKQTLNELGLQLSYKWFPDHYQYQAEDLDSLPDQIIMTEKDAVKILPFSTENMWYLRIGAQLPKPLFEDLKTKLVQWENSHG